MFDEKGYLQDYISRKWQELKRSRSSYLEIRGIPELKECNKLDHEFRLSDYEKSVELASLIKYYKSRFPKSDENVLDVIINSIQPYFGNNKRGLINILTERSEQARELHEDDGGNRNG